MKKAFLETTAINHALFNSANGRKLREELQSKGYSPVVGIHVVYELARTFLNPKDFETGQRLFAIVRDLDPSYSPPPVKLFEQEVLKLKTGSAVLPFLDYLGQASMRTEVHRLAMGNFDDKARRFIERRESEIKLEHPRNDQAYLAHIQDVRSDQGAQNAKLRTFEDVLTYFQPQIPDAIHQRLQGSITRSEANELVQRLDSFLAIRSAVRADVYLNFICIVHKDTPGFDKIDDYRHVIESSYCDVIITGDRQLYRSANRINPDIEVVSCNDIFKYR
ncbi:MAG: hypothetical protein JRG69_12520 [Deltaproteobacteria bacterium]|nr:hypothetical protein [Deltaproteobacteria bacterium]